MERSTIEDPCFHQDLNSIFVQVQLPIKQENSETISTLESPTVYLDQIFTAPLDSQSFGQQKLDPLTSSIQRQDPEMSWMFDEGEPELASPVSGSLPLLDDLDLVSPLTDASMTMNPTDVAGTEDPFLDQAFDLSQFLELQQQPPAPPATTSDVALPEATPVILVLPAEAPPKRKADSVTTDHDQYVTKQRKVEVASTSGVEDDLSPYERYRQRRDKNNEASKVSRYKRKDKQRDQETHVRSLQQDNESLQLKVDALEQLAGEMKRTLISHMAAKKQ